jgi:hypothetical protein
MSEESNGLPIGLQRLKARPIIDDAMIDVTARLKACPDTNFRPAKRTPIGKPFVGEGARATPGPNFLRFFLYLPQAILIVHRFRTAGPRILIANQFQMRDIALTAGVTVTLPVIAQGWFCDSFPQGL